MNLQNLLDGAVNVVFARRLAVVDLDRECSTGNGKSSGVSEETGKLLVSCRHEKDIIYTFSAFMVADVTMTLRSRRLVRTENSASVNQMK